MRHAARAACVALVSGVLCAGALAGCAVARAIAVEGQDANPDAGGGVALFDASDGEAPSDAAFDGASSLACTDAAFVSDASFGIWTDAGDGFIVFNNVYDQEAGPGPQTLYACSYASWYVVSEQTNDAGAVASYPNVQMNFDPELSVAGLDVVTSTFAETAPSTGTYEFAFDVWLNGRPGTGDQIMVWVDTQGRRPTGTQMTTMTFGDRVYDVWQGTDRGTDGGIVSLVASTRFASGTVDLLQMFRWVLQDGLLSATSTISQVDFGVEIQSTAPESAVFQVDDFSLTTM